MLIGSSVPFRSELNWTELNGNGKIVLTYPWLKVIFNKEKNGKLILRGELKISNFRVGSNPVNILIGQDAILEIKGDFVIGPGVRLLLTPNSRLIIGGKKFESESGITANTLIMVNKKVEIGNDFLCAWDVFITDSDWHSIEGQKHQSDVSIGNHVWIANNNNILKGSHIGNNSIVASNSKIVNKKFTDNVMIGGIPQKILKTNINWNRDI